MRKLWWDLPPLRAKYVNTVEVDMHSLGVNVVVCNMRWNSDLVPPPPPHSRSRTSLLPTSSLSYPPPILVKVQFHEADIF